MGSVISMIRGDKSIHRKHFITHWKIQARLAGILAASFLIFCALIGAIFLWSWTNLSTTSEGLSVHDMLVTKVLLIHQGQSLLFYFSVVVTAYIVAISIFLMIFTHRMTGPVHKLTRILNEASDSGTMPKSIRFRKTDAFPELEKSMNRFLNVLRNGHFAHQFEWHTQNKKVAKTKS